MNLTTLFWIVVYFMIGWFMADACADANDSAQYLIFIAWPLIIGTVIVVYITLLILGFIEYILKFFAGDGGNDGTV